MMNKEDQHKQETRFPSFSIIFETENLSSVELENIYRSLASIAAQDTSPEQANEFLIIDGGQAPTEVLEKLCLTYSWITVRQTPGIGYYEAKMMGAALATGEVIVFCDSDCTYGSNWLRNILTTFLQDSEINIVAGETSTPIRNLYELAIAMHYFFPRFLNREYLYKSKEYFLNNVAFRRDFLLKSPIPTDLPLYRGNCSLHAHSLCNLRGNMIWKHPQARATHESPTMSFVSWRYLLRGRDRVLREHMKLRLTESPDTVDYSQLLGDLNPKLHQRIRGIISIVLQVKPFHPKQIRTVLREDLRRIVLFPLAVPIMLWFELLYTIGSVITYLQPNLILKLYGKVESEFGESTPNNGRNFSTIK